MRYSYLRYAPMAAVLTIARWNKFEPSRSATRILKEVSRNFERIRHRSQPLRSCRNAGTRQLWSCNLILRILADVVDLCAGSDSMGASLNSISQPESSADRESWGPLVGNGRSVEVGGVRSGWETCAAMDTSVDTHRCGRDSD